jgi:hypothetical protein
LLGLVLNKHDISFDHLWESKGAAEHEKGLVLGNKDTPMTAEVMKKEVSRKMNQLMRLFSQKIMMLLKVKYQNSTRTANVTDSQKNGQDDSQKFSGKEKSQEFDS